MRGFARLRRGLGERERALSGFHRARELREIAETFSLLRELLFLGDYACDILIELGQTIAMAANIRFELSALGGKVGECSGEFGKQPFGVRKRRLGLRHAGVDA